MKPESFIAGALPDAVKCSCANKACEICLPGLVFPWVPTQSNKGPILKALGKLSIGTDGNRSTQNLKIPLRGLFFPERYIFFFSLYTLFYSLLNENTPFSRYTIYSPKDGQPCMDHDRQTGEVIFLLDTFMHCV